MNTHYKPKERLYWQCRRGMLELDELLQAFLDAQYDNLDETSQLAFQRLLRCPDQDLQAYLLGGSDPKDRDLAHVTRQIRITYQP